MMRSTLAFSTAIVTAIVALGVLAVTNVINDLAGVIAITTLALLNRWLLRDTPGDCGDESG